MKKVIRLAGWLLSFFIFQTTICAQSNWSVSGTVLDSVSAPLAGATIMLTHLADDRLEGFAIADEAGAFEIAAQEAGAFKLRITYVGYGSFEREVGLTEATKTLDFGKIILRTDAVDLTGVTVKESFLPIVIKKDTVEYHADAFKTRPNANVEDLLKKLPGVEVEKDGTIKAQGEEVEQIFVDGKEFFDDDPKIASRNIPADVVNKVQVFDKKSDFTEFTGIDDGNESKAINLKIKEGKNKGTFGNLKGSYGTDNRYLAAGNINRFDAKMQLSALANANNTNQQAFSLMDYLRFTGGLDDLMNGGNIDFDQLPTNLIDNAGVTKSYSGGVNFNYDFGQKTQWRSNYFYDYSDNRTRVDNRFQRLLDEGVFTNTSAGDQFNQLRNHRIALKLNHQFNPSQDLKTSFRMGFSDNEKQSSSDASSFSTGGALANHSNTFRTMDFQNRFWSSQTSFRKKFKKKGRFFTAGIELEGKDNDGENYLNNTLTIYEAPTKTDSLTQLQNSQSNQLNYRADVNYVEPLGEAKYLSFSASRSTDDAVGEKSFWEETTHGNFVVNEPLGNHFERRHHITEGGLAFKWIRPSFNISLGADYQVIDVDNDDLKRNTAFGKSFKSPLPNARFDYQIGQGTQLTVSYRTRMNVPAFEQIQPVIDNLDPLNTYIGNPDLDAEYVHGIDVDFSNINQFYFRNLFLRFNAQFIQNSIIEAVTTNDQLVSIRTPVNGKPAWQMGGYYNYSSPIRGINFKFRYSGELRLQKTNLLTNDVADQAINTSWRQTFLLENKLKEKLNWSGGIRLNNGFTKYRMQVDAAQNFMDYTFFLDIIWPFATSWTLETNLEHQRFSPTDFSDPFHFNFIHVTLTKSFFDGLLSVYAKGLNLLDENIMIQRNSFGNQYNETTKNRLGKYALVGVVYKLRSFGK